MYTHFQRLYQFALPSCSNKQSKIKWQYIAYFFCYLNQRYNYVIINCIVMPSSDLFHWIHFQERFLNSGTEWMLWVFLYKMTCVSRSAWDFLIIRSIIISLSFYVNDFKHKFLSLVERKFVKSIVFGRQFLNLHCWQLFVFYVPTETQSSSVAFLFLLPPRGNHWFLPFSSTTSSIW